MLKAADKAKLLEFGFDPEKLISAITDAKEVSIPFPDGRIYKESDIDELKTNVKSSHEKDYSEIYLRKLNKDYELGLTASDAKDEKRVLKAMMEKAVKDAGVEPDKKVKELEASIKKLQDAEDERVRLEEEKIAAEEKAAAEEKERRRKAKLEKKEAQVAAGTFMTKAEKEKQKKIQARLDALKAAGVALPAVESTAPAGPVKASDLYKNTKPAKNNNKPKVEEETKPEPVVGKDLLFSIGIVFYEPCVSSCSICSSIILISCCLFPPLPLSLAAVTEAAPQVADDWDADSDWETNLDAITMNLEVGLLV